MNDSTDIQKAKLLMLGVRLEPYEGEGEEGSFFANRGKRRFLYFNPENVFTGGTPRWKETGWFAASKGPVTFEEVLEAFMTPSPTA